jgi:hypothetical protein
MAELPTARSRAGKVDVGNSEVSAVTTAVSPSAADAFMCRLLRVSAVDPMAVIGAQNALRRSVVVSGVRCAFTYLLVPILVPTLGVMGSLAAPLSLVLCLYAMVNGVVGVRRFWVADHRAKWKYTWFMTAVLVFLLVAIALDVTRLVA